MKFPRMLAIVTATALAGCGPTQVPISPRTPHGGMLLSLPDSGGSVEVVRRSVDDQAGKSRLLLYFLDADMKPMNPAPTVATLKGRGRNGGSFDFRKPTDADSSNSSMLECPSIPDQGDIDGELSVTIGDKPIKLSINVR